MIGLLPALISGGGALLGGAMQANAAKKAAGQQMAMYEQTRKDLTPYREAGEKGLDPWLSELGIGEDGAYNPKMYDFSVDALSENFKESPGYQYQIDEMMRAAQNSAAARGVLGSGATLKALQRNAQGLASQDYWNYYNASRQSVADTRDSDQMRIGNLQNLSNMGVGAATQTGQFGANAATNAGKFGTSGSAAMASGLTGAANAFQQFAKNNNYFQGFNQEPD
jgi:hypothetical protein